MLFLFLLGCSNVYSQNRYETDSIKAYSLINKETSSLKKSEWISIFDDTGKIVIIWKERGKHRAIKLYYKGKDCKKSKRQKLLKDDKSNIDNLLGNPEIISEINNDRCNEMVHSFNKVNIDITLNDKVYHNSFYSHCEQKNQLKSLMSLYFNLRN